MAKASVQFQLQNGIFQPGSLLAAAQPPPVLTTNSLLFDGTSDYIANPTGIQPALAFTVSMWIKNTGNFGAYRDLSSKAGADGTWVFAFQVNPSNLLEFWVSLNGSSGTLQATSGGTVGPGQSGSLLHVLCTATAGSPGRLAIYLNGVNSALRTNAAVTWLQNSAAFKVGSFGAGGDFFKGTLGGYRFYNTAFSDADALQAYNDGPNGTITNTTGLLISFPMTGQVVGTSAVGQSIPDTSGNGNNGTGNGSAATLTYQLQS